MDNHGVGAGTWDNTSLGHIGWHGIYSIQSPENRASIVTLSPDIVITLRIK